MDELSIVIIHALPFIIVVMVCSGVAVAFCIFGLGGYVYCEAKFIKLNEFKLHEAVRQAGTHH